MQVVVQHGILQYYNMSIITWDNANILWNNNEFTWDDVVLIQRITSAGEDYNSWEKEDKDKLVKLILKVHGNTITESKQKEIKEYKIKATDIKLAIKKITNVGIVTENIKL